jgi:AraC-like DNA-binding protein/quercetin dioxygenase-like cupin family protein
MISVKEIYDKDTGRRIRSFIFNPPWSCIAHWHNDVELVYVMSNSLTIAVNNDLIILNEGELLLIPPKVSHSYLPQSKDFTIFLTVTSPSVIQAIGLSEKESDFYKRLISTIDVYSFPKGSDQDSRMRHKLEATMSNMAKEFTDRSIGYQMALESLLLRIFLIMIRKMDVRTIPNSMIIKTHTSKFLDSVFEYVEAHFNEKIKLEDIIKIVNLNKSYFCRVFKESMGVSFVKYVNCYRLNKAEWMLLVTDMLVSDISRSVGFASLDNFNRLFKKHYGFSPSQFRKKNS